MYEELKQHNIVYQRIRCPLLNVLLTVANTFEDHVKKIRRHLEVSSLLVQPGEAVAKLTQDINSSPTSKSVKHWFR